MTPREQSSLNFLLEIMFWKNQFELRNPNWKDILHTITKKNNKTALSTIKQTPTQESAYQIEDLIYSQRREKRK